MKNRIVKIISAVFVLSLLFQFANAQSASKSIDKKYNWTDETEEFSVFVDVKSNAKEISMAFNGEVSKGNLTVTAYNPDGKKESGFCLITNCALECGAGKNNQKASKNSNSNSNSNYSVSSSSGKGSASTSISRTDEGYSYSCSSSEDSSGAKGNMHEIMSDPMPGKWEFVIKATQVTGKLEVDVSQK